MDPEQRSDLDEMYERFRTLFSAGAQEHEEEVVRLLLLEASQAKLRSAARAALGPLADVRQLQQDVVDEATKILWERLRRGRVRYEDRGPVAFSDWLWRLWYFTCRRAWRKLRPRWQKRIETDRGEGFPAEILDEADWERRERKELVEWLRAEIDRLPDARQRDVLTDLLAGMSGRESARYRDMEEWEVSTIRKDMIARLKRLFHKRG